MRAVPIRDVDDTVARWIGTNTDIEDQKAATEALERLNAGLEQEVEERTRERDRSWRLTQDIQIIISGAGISKPSIQHSRASSVGRPTRCSAGQFSRMLVTEVLQELGYAALEAADAPSGLKVLQSDTSIDLLVTDVGLPGGMNGRQMADAARVTRPELKVLFIRGYE